MFESTAIIAFDQHAASVVAAVLLPGQRTPAIHPLNADLPTIGRFVARVMAHHPVLLL
jgi:energy-converting hydrogenase Eha subunit E